MIDFGIAKLLTERAGSTRRLTRTPGQWVRQPPGFTLRVVDD